MFLKLFNVYGTFPSLLKLLHAYGPFQFTDNHSYETFFMFIVFSILTGLPNPFVTF